DGFFFASSSTARRKCFFSSRRQSSFLPSQCWWYTLLLEVGRLLLPADALFRVHVHLVEGFVLLQQASLIRHWQVGFFCGWLLLRLFLNGLEEVLLLLSPPELFLPSQCWWYTLLLEVGRLLLPADALFRVHVHLVEGFVLLQQASLIRHWQVGFFCGWLLLRLFLNGLEEVLLLLSPPELFLPSQCWWYTLLLEVAASSSQ
uniref:Secreted protein n=1 Tax=Macrostomum lignano TaxID=282301 RepID=A0A1I8JKS2_9PLAT